MALFLANSEERLTLFGTDDDALLKNDLDT